MIWWIAVAVYVLTGFVLAHRSAPAFVRYTWADYRLLLIMVFVWPIVLVHDWWVNRNIFAEKNNS